MSDSSFIKVDDIKSMKEKCLVILEYYNEKLKQYKKEKKEVTQKRIDNWRNSYETSVSTRASMSFKEIFKPIKYSDREIEKIFKLNHFLSMTRYNDINEKINRIEYCESVISRVENIINLSEGYNTVYLYQGDVNFIKYRYSDAIKGD